MLERYYYLLDEDDLREIFMNADPMTLSGKYINEVVFDVNGKRLEMNGPQFKKFLAENKVCVLTNMKMTFNFETFIEDVSLCTHEIMS